MHGVKRVYGRRSSFDVSAGLHPGGARIDIVLTMTFDLDCLCKDGTLKKRAAIFQRYTETANMCLRSGIKQHWKSEIK